MSLPDHITYGIGGTVSLGLLSQPTNAQVRVLKSDGTVVLNSTAATINSVSVTVSGTPLRGDRAINVSANTGIVAGTTLHISDDEEEILVRQVAGTQLNLRRPIQHDHVNAAPVKGTLCTVTINAAVANTLWWDGRAEWNIDGGAAMHYTAVECTKYPLARLATIQDVLDLEPQFFYQAEDEVDRERLLDLAHEHVLKQIARVAPNHRVRVFPGSMEFRTAVALAALKLFYMPQAGEAARELYQRYHEAMETEIAAIVGVVARDTDQDGVVEADEQISIGTVRVMRG